MIVFQGLHKTYPNGKEIIKGIDLTFETNSITSIFGPSGGGKSTMVKLISGIEKPTGGKVLIDRQDINELSYNELRELRKNIGFVFQESALFDSITNYDNIAFPLRERGYKEKDIADMVYEMINLVKMSEDVGKKFPNELSGGMKKRVGLARAIITNPQIVLYDEPTSGLDPVTSAYITELIIDMQRRFQNTSVLISHNVNEVLSSDHVAVLYGGKIIDYGTSKEIKNSKNEYTRQMLEGNTKGPIK